jgi:hypothetical protein
MPNDFIQNFIEYCRENTKDSKQYSKMLKTEMEDKLEEAPNKSQISNEVLFIQAEEQSMKIK